VPPEKIHDRQHLKTGIFVLKTEFLFNWFEQMGYMNFFTPQTGYDESQNHDVLKSEAMHQATASNNSTAL
jgi:hypothetical protein